MAFKMKNSGGAFKTMGSSSPNKAGGYVKPGGKATGEMKDYALNSQARADEYDARGWAHDKTSSVKAAKAAPKAAPAAPAGTSETVKNKVGGRSTTTETGVNAKGQAEAKVTKNRADGTARKETTYTNHSTWDPETQTGSSGPGMEKGVKRLKKDGTARRNQKNTFSKGTDSKKDDTVVKSRSQRKPGGRSVTKTKDGETGKSSKSVVRGERGNRATQVNKSKNVSLHSGGTGTSKTKHYTKGKKAGTSETTERKKGKIFGKKVDIDYS